MADRYQDRPYPDQDDYGRGSDPHAAGRGESDPLAELARLIGQTDPFAMGRANVKAQPRAEQRPPAQQYQPPEIEDELPAGPPPWMQRAHRQEAAPPPPEPEYEEEPEYQPSPVHPLHRYAAQHAAPEPHYPDEPQHSDEQYAGQQYAEQTPDPSRYDDALFGQIESGQDYQRDPAYPDDPYAYQPAYDEEPEEPRRRGGLVTVVAILALAVLGTGGAFAYRSFVGSSRGGEPPIIRADNSPTKVVPASADNAPKVADRMALGDGSEKLVPREESPVDVNARSGPRVVFPPLNQNTNPPSVASVAPGAPPPSMPTANGTLPSNEPRKVRTLTVKGDAADSGLPANAPPARPAVVAPASRTAAAPPPAAARSPSSANASANAPLSLTPGASAAPEMPARVAAVNPAPAVAAPAAGGGGGGFVVQVSSQKNEADAQASYKALQGKFPAVLGSRAPLIKRADLGDKGVYYRAMVGPFGSQDEAAQFCGNLKTAGGQCVVQRN
jgi:SPOR domain